MDLIWLLHKHDCLQGIQHGVCVCVIKHYLGDPGSILDHVIVFINCLLHTTNLYYTLLCRLSGSGDGGGGDGGGGDDGGGDSEDDSGLGTKPEPWTGH